MSKKNNNRNKQEINQKAKPNTNPNLKFAQSQKKSKNTSIIKIGITLIGIVGSVIGIISWRDSIKKQNEIDSQLSVLYQTEISHFYSQYRILLHWSLPLGQVADKEIESIFKYDKELVKGFNLNKIDKNIARLIFNQYDFTKPMANYYGDDVKGKRPTGFNHLLGNLKRFQYQVEKHLEKYGNSANSELTNRLEYSQSKAKAQISSIRLNLKTQGHLSEQTIDEIGDFLVLIRDDLNWLSNKYGKEIYPVLVGIVEKSDPVNGSLAVEWEYADY